MYNNILDSQIRATSYTNRCSPIVQTHYHENQPMLVGTTVVRWSGTTTVRIFYLILLVES